MGGRRRRPQREGAPRGTRRPETALSAGAGRGASSIRVTFLGTTAGMPTGTRGLPAVAIARQGEVLLCDCGESTQFQIRKAGIRTGRLSRILISHMHGDHVLGLPGVLMSLQLSGRTAPLEIHGPPGIEEFVRATLRMTEARVLYPLHIAEHGGAEEIARGADYRLECRPLEHRTFSLGYALVEDDILGVLDAEEARRLGVPHGPLMGRLKAGQAVALANGATVLPAQVLSPARPGKRIAYCGDTRPVPACVALAAGADLLIHEATFLSDRAADAQEKTHSTAAGAAEVAREAGARRLALTHISPRYTDPAPLLAEAQAVFPNTVVAEDLLVLDV